MIWFYLEVHEVSVLVDPNKITRTRAAAVATTTLVGLGVAMVAQRRQSAEDGSDMMARDILRTTHIAPDGGRINGAWIASNYADQDFVNLAQNVHAALLGGRHLPPIARNLLTQRCQDLETGLLEREADYTGSRSIVSDTLRKRLSALRVSLMDDARSGGSETLPLSESDRVSLAKLVEAVTYPLCLWEAGELRDMRRTSDSNLGTLRL
jgi:hypothetical protein